MTLLSYIIGVLLSYIHGVLFSYILVALLSYILVALLSFIIVALLPKLCLFSKLQFFHLFKEGYLPVALRNMRILNRERNPDILYRLRNENEIHNFTSRLSHFENFPLYCIPALWSSFSNENVKI